MTSAYAVSWGYVIGDVAYEGYNNHKEGMNGNELYRSVIKRTVFQSFASMALPALTIHQTVHFMKKYFFTRYLTQYAKRGPTMCGLAVIPALPYMFDHPVEHACDFVFDKVWESENDKDKYSNKRQPHMNSLKIPSKSII